MPSYRYPGPRPFEETDIDLFFGRDKDKKNLLTFINVEPLVVLFSKSGLGKSSLVNAAIIPELRKKNYEIILCRFNSYVSKEPGENNYETTSPLQKVFNEIEARFTIAPTFLDKLIENTKGLSLWHQFKSLQISGTEKKTYFIFFDQFEELFTYPVEQVKAFKENLAELLNPTIPQEYLDQINESENNPSSDHLTDEQLGLLYEPIPVKLLFTIRSDKFSLLTNLKDAIPGMVTKTYELKPFDRIEATKAIKNPASIEDSAEGNFISNAFTYDDDAIKKMLNYLTDNDTEDIESFQLQVLCRYVEEMVLDNKRRNNELKNITASQLGEIKNVFEDYYNKLINDIDKDKIKNVKKLFEDGLIFEKDKIRVSLYEGQIADYGVDETLLNTLVSTHLIRCEPDANGREKYELSHDSLIEPILKAKEKRVDEERITLQKITLKKRVRLFAAVIAGIILVCGIALFFFLRNAKSDKMKINFLVAEKDWFYLLDETQRKAVLDNDFLFLIDKNSEKYNNLKYSYKCAAYANQAAETNYPLALEFAQEGFLKDSTNPVITRSFNNLIHKSNVYVPAKKIKYPGIINNIKITKDESSVIATTNRGVFWFNAKTHAIQDSLTSDSAQSDYSAFSPDGHYVVYELFNSDTTYLLNLLTKHCIKIKDREYAEEHAIAFDIAKDNSFFIHAGSANVISVISINGSLLKKYSFPKDVDINEVSISPDGNYFAAGANGGEVFLVDLKNPDVKKSISLLTSGSSNLHTAAVNSVSFSHDGKFILTGSVDKTIQIWDIDNKRVFQTINNKNPVSRCRFSDDDAHILIGEIESGTIAYWSKEASANTGNSNSRNAQSDTLKFSKDTLQLVGLDSRITSINFYNNDTKIIASSQNEISLWNLNNDNKSPLQINDVVTSGIIPVFQLREKLYTGLVSFKELLGSTQTKNDVLETIKLLSDSITRISMKRNRQTTIELTNLMPKFYDHLKNCPEGKLTKRDSFLLYNYMSNGYLYKIYLDEDSLNGNFGKNSFENLVKFRQQAFKLDTAKNECFLNLMDAYLIPVDYAIKNKQYNVSLFWSNKILKDNPWLNTISEIQNSLTIIYQYQVSLNVLKGDLQAAKKALQNWPGPQDDLSYILSKELIQICTVPHYSFNKAKFSSYIKNIDVKNEVNKDKISNMDMNMLDLIDEKNYTFSENVMNNIIAFDDYIYPLAY